VNNDEVIAKIHGLDVKASQIGEMANQRAFANDFVTKVLSQGYTELARNFPNPASAT